MPLRESVFKIFLQARCSRLRYSDRVDQRSSVWCPNCPSFIQTPRGKSGLMLIFWDRVSPLFSLSLSLSFFLFSLYLSHCPSLSVSCLLVCFLNRRNDTFSPTYSSLVKVMPLDEISCKFHPDCKTGFFHLLQIFRIYIQVIVWPILDGAIVLK